MNSALLIFEALGHETRFKVFDLIYRSGSVGMRPKEMIDAFGFDSGTLDFHLKKLIAAKLIGLKVGCRRGVYCFREDIPSWLIQSFDNGNSANPLLIGGAISPQTSNVELLH